MTETAPETKPSKPAATKPARAPKPSEAVKPGRKARPKFVPSIDPNANDEGPDFDGDGLMITAPHIGSQRNWFDPAVHATLHRGDFADDVTYLEHQRNLLQVEIADRETKIDALTGRINALLACSDPEVRRKIAKAQKAADDLQEAIGKSGGTVKLSDVLNIGGGE